MPRKMSGMAMIMIDESMVASRTPAVVLVSATHLYLSSGWNTAGAWAAARAECLPTVTYSALPGRTAWAAGATAGSAAWLQTRRILSKLPMFWLSGQGWDGEGRERGPAAPGTPGQEPRLSACWEVLEPRFHYGPGALRRAGRGSAVGRAPPASLSSLTWCRGIRQRGSARSRHGVPALTAGWSEGWVRPGPVDLHGPPVPHAPFAPPAAPVRRQPTPAFHDAEITAVDYRSAVVCRDSSTQNQPQNRNQPRKWGRRDWCAARDRTGAGAARDRTGPGAARDRTGPGRPQRLQMSMGG